MRVLATLVVIVTVAAAGGAAWLAMGDNAVTSAYQAAAWAPIVEATGIPVFIPGVPLNIAVLGGDHIAQVRRAYPQITTWVVGGHSMGGFVASGHLAGGSDDGPDRRPDAQTLHALTAATAAFLNRVVPAP